LAQVLAEAELAPISSPVMEKPMSRAIDRLSDKLDVEVAKGRMTSRIHKLVARICTLIEREEALRGT
jgi:hypothetical protein